jgi:uncharacterized protein with von Willebrand factor type A (vWA) domain
MSAAPWTDHIKVCEELFSAARTEFKNMEFYYFHNCLYESVWKDNRRCHAEKHPTWDVLHKFSRRLQGHLRGRRDHEPRTEITYPGGSVEHWNEEPAPSGSTASPRPSTTSYWLNPTAERHWDYTPSVGVMRQLVGDRMFPLTLEGLEKAMKELARSVRRSQVEGRAWTCARGSRACRGGDSVRPGPIRI